MQRKITAVAFAAVLTTLFPCAARSDVVPIAVEDGGCELVVDSARPSDHFYLILGSLANGSRTTRVAICTNATAAPGRVPADMTAVPSAWRELVHEQATRQEKARLLRKPVRFMPAAAPAKTRVFHVFVKDRDLENPSHYAAVTAELRAVGRHCQVYVDRDVVADAGLAALMAEILHTFDEGVFPWASRHLGCAHDVDRDGRFTIVLTPRLGKLQDGAVSVDGYVRGSDFSLDLAAPFSNHCDAMYLNSRLQPGPHLRTLLAHEYAHAVTYCEHVLENYLPGATRQDEEGWLNEGLAHLVEEQLGYGWSNLDYRIGAYLAWPERYPLVVPDYFHSGLWRIAGPRGAAFLFLRSCRERHGLGLLTRLCRSNLAGVANLETATRERFDELFRHWAVAQMLDDSAWTRKAGLGRLCLGPRFHDMALAGDRQEFPIVGTGVLYLRLHSPSAARTRIVVRGEPGALLQVTLVRPSAEQPWLQLRCEASATPGRVRLFLTAHGGDVRIEGAAWERLLPTGKANEDTSFSAAQPRKTVLEWWAAAALQAGQTAHSMEIVLPDSARRADLVFKVLGRDAAGNALAAWAVLRPNGEASSPGL